MTRVASLLLFLFLCTGCDKVSPFGERLVEVHFSPALSVEEAIEYASKHEARINNVALRSMTFVETDSGEVEVEYVDTEYETGLFFTVNPRSEVNALNSIEPDGLLSLLRSRYAEAETFYYHRMIEREEEIRQLEEDIATYQGPSSVDTQIKEAAQGMTNEEAQEWINKNIWSFDTLGRSKLERELRSVEEWHTVLKTQYDKFTLVDADTYVEALQIQSMVLKVEGIRFMSRDSSVVRVGRL